MISVARIRGAFSYLSGAGPAHNWRLSAAVCPHCGPSHFVGLQSDPYFIRCLKCRANGVNLSIIATIQRNVTGLLDKEAYEMSTYGSTYSFLKRNCSRFHCSEFIPGHKSGEWINGTLNEDAQQLSFADESLDIITSNQVFEHVPDDLAAYRECWRTLRPGGSLSFTVPLRDACCTVQVATIKDGAVNWLSTPEFHASRLTGPNSVPVFWRFSVNDISERVAVAGFREVSLVKVTIVPQQVTPQIVVHAVK